MKKISYIFLFLIFTVNLGYSQYSEEEFSKFVKIHLSSKRQLPNADSIANQFFALNPEKKDEYIKAFKAQDSNKNEKRAPIVVVDSLNALIDINKNNLIKELCKEYGMPNEKYNEILDLYRNNWIFANKLSPYFQKEIEGR